MKRNGEDSTEPRPTRQPEQEWVGDWERKKELVRIVSDEKPPPVPAWFLGYLSQAVPEDLVLTEFRVARTNNLWSVVINGTAQPTTNASPWTVFRQAFTSLTNNLAMGPFHLQISRSVTGGGAAAPPPTANAAKGIKNTFSIEGVIR